MLRTIKHRKKEHKTDYAKRIKLLKSKSPRIVFRRTNKYIIAQYVESEEAKDKVKVGVSSKILLKYGWDKKAEGSLKSITASYLTGLLFGKKIKGMPEPIVDIGMNRNLHKTKVFGFIQGLIDAGIKIKCKKEAFPSEDRIQGKHLKNKVNFTEIKSKIEKEK